jgi:hypothetical protein
MPKETKINLKSQTQSQETYFVDRHQDTANTLAELFTRDDFGKVKNKVNLETPDKSSLKVT